METVTIANETADDNTIRTAIYQIIRYVPIREHNVKNNDYLHKKMLVINRQEFVYLSHKQ